MPRRRGGDDIGEDDMDNDMGDDVNGNIPTVRDMISNQIGVSMERAITLLAKYHTGQLSAEARIKYLTDLASQLKYERDLYKRLWQSETMKADTASALLIKALDKNDAMTLETVKSRMNMQDILVKYAETRQTLVSIIGVIDELRALIRKFVPQTDIDRAEDLIEFIKDTVDKLSIEKPVPVFPHNIGGNE